MRVVVAALLAALVLPAASSAGTVFLLDGGGWGHGVGMSQWGAEGYARHGYSYRRILAHYYPRTTLSSWRPRQVRVLLGQGKTAVRIGSAAPFEVVDARGRKLHLAGRTVVVDRRFVLRHAKLTQPLRFEAGAQPLTYNLAGYRGELLVKAKPGGLMVVNRLPLDRYLRGVVPWEVPSGWHEATYEAQAVAARSYTLATLHPNADFDLYPDQRSQMYGGIRAERPLTNLAVGATAGQVLAYGGAVIPAFYFSSSGGRTAAVQDVWPKAQPVPYLVSVADPYDSISPRHTWPTRVLTTAAIGARLHLRHVRDATVVDDASGRVSVLRVLAGSHWHRYAAATIRKRFDLGSTDFELRALSLDAPASHVLYGTRTTVRGWVRGLGGVRLQELTDAGWSTVAPVHTATTGRFRLSLPVRRSTELRLVYRGLAGATVPLTVAPRVSLRAHGTRLRVRVAPALPLQVQRLTRRAWTPVARSTGSFAADLRPGSYRVFVLGGAGYAREVTRAVGLRGPK